MPEHDDRPDEADEPEREDEDEDAPDVEGTGPDYFAGEETIEGVMEEIEEKEES